MNDPNEIYKNRFFNSGLFTIAKPINTKNDITPTILKIPIILFIFISFYKLMFCRVLLALPPTVFAYESGRELKNQKLGKSTKDY